MLLLICWEWELLLFPLEEEALLLVVGTDERPSAPAHSLLSRAHLKAVCLCLCLCLRCCLGLFLLGRGTDE